MQSLLDSLECLCCLTVPLMESPSRSVIDPRECGPVGNKPSTICHSQEAVNLIGFLVLLLA